MTVHYQQLKGGICSDCHVFMPGAEDAGSVPLCSRCDELRRLRISCGRWRRAVIALEAALIGLLIWSQADPTLACAASAPAATLPTRSVPAFSGAPEAAVLPQGTPLC